MISDNNQQFRSQLSALSSNQTELKKNISTLVNQLETISSQVYTTFNKYAKDVLFISIEIAFERKNAFKFLYIIFQLKQLNSSVITLLEELDAAPYLKTLPGEVSDVQKQVAQFGSRLTDLESELTKSETELRSDIGDIKNDMAKKEV